MEWFREVVEGLAELVGWFCGGKMWPRAVRMGVEEKFFLRGEVTEWE